MLGMRLKLEFVGEIFGRERGIDGPRVVRFGKVGIGIGAEKAAESKSRRDVVQREKFGRAERAGKGRIAVNDIEVAPRIEAAEHASRVALAGLLLDAQAIVIFTKIGAHEIDNRVGAGLIAQRTANRIKIAAVDVAAVKKVPRIAVAVDVDAGAADGQRVADRDVEHAAQFDRFEIAVRSLHTAGEFAELRPRRDDVDDARRCVSSE